MQAVIKAAKAAIMAVRDRDLNQHYKASSRIDIKGIPEVKKPTFNWKSQQKYTELCNCEIEV